MSVSWSILLPGLPLSSERGALGWSTVTLLRTCGRTILIDTGSYGDRALLLSRLEDEKITPADVDSVFLTHFHFDHVLNFDLFENAVFRLSEREMKYVEDEEFRKAKDPYVPFAVFDKIGPRIKSFSEGAELAPGIRAVPLPGHTPGLCGYLLEEERVLVAGDGVKNAWEFIREAPPPAFGGRDDALESYRRAVSCASVIIPGHDRPFRVPVGERVEYLQEFSIEVISAGDPHAALRKIVLP